MLTQSLNRFLGINIIVRAKRDVRFSNDLESVEFIAPGRFEIGEYFPVLFGNKGSDFAFSFND